MFDGGIMKKNVKKILLIVGAILIICVLCFIMSRTSENSNYADKYEGVDLTAEVEGLNSFLYNSKCRE